MGTFRARQMRRDGSCCMILGCVHGRTFGSLFCKLHKSSGERAMRNA